MVADETVERRGVLEDEEEDDGAVDAACWLWLGCCDCDAATVEMTTPSVER